MKAKSSNMQKTMFLAVIAALLLSGCGSGPEKQETPAATTRPADTLTYAYKATYSSDLAVPGDAEDAQKVLRVWKAFETGQIEAMKLYFADTVTYEDASGMRFHGPVEQLLAFAKKDIGGLDSMRFDISQWQSTHVNDRNEDWVNIWSTERRYPPKGRPDTVLMQENWKVKDGKVVYFNQYLARLPK
jgi:hypothetical protein